MTAVAAEYTWWAPIQPGTQLPSGNTYGIASGTSAGYGQAVYFDASGNVVLNDGTVANLVAAGVVDPTRMAGLTTPSKSTALMVHMGWGSGIPASTEAGDGFTAADQAVVVYDAGNGVPGKLSAFGGNKRSVMGLAFGVDDKGRPIVWCSPVASIIARALSIANVTPFAWYDIADAAASTAIAERVIGSTPVNGLITTATFTGAAIAADNTDYGLVTIAKRSLSDAYAAATTVATYDTRITGQGAILALTPKSLVLSGVAGVLNILPTDIFTIVTSKGGAGKTFTGRFSVNGKAI